MMSQKEIDKQMLALDYMTFVKLEESNVPEISEYMRLCKKDKDIQEACKNGNIVGVEYLIKQDNDDIMPALDLPPSMVSLI
jgi:hypothetical protein